MKDKMIRNILKDTKLVTLAIISLVIANLCSAIVAALSYLYLGLTGLLCYGLPLLILVFVVTGVVYFLARATE